MKKIMFNDRYGLTWAVLNGEKTQTRRVANKICTHLINIDENDFLEFSRYNVGDVVAIAQSYKTICDNSQMDPKSAEKKTIIWQTIDKFLPENIWDNKMFTKAELMPHHIEITGIRIERLNDISPEDCIKEGIKEYPNFEDHDKKKYDVTAYAEKMLKKDNKDMADTPKEAYACLIDKIGKTGDWAQNPWVYVYDFKLID